MSLVDKVFGVDEKVQAIVKERMAMEKATFDQRLDLEKSHFAEELAAERTDMDKRIAETEVKMIEISDQRATEKAQEIATQMYENWRVDMEKADKEKYDAEAKSYMYDPFTLIESLGYKERIMSMSYDTLRLMSERNAVVASIINTRIHQVTAFARPPRTKYDIGYEFVLRDRDEEPTELDKRRMKELGKFLESTGLPAYTEEESRDSLEQFLSKIVRDSLTYDQACYEIVNGRNKKPLAFYAVDGSTIRYATTPSVLKRMAGYSEAQVNEMWRRQMVDMNQNVFNRGQAAEPERVKYVQVISGRVMNTYTEQEMGFAIRNPRTYLQQNNYGVGELEIMVSVVTAHLWAEEYNKRFFSTGSAPKGILHFDVSGANIPQEQLNAFRRQWHAQVAGVWNAWKTPILATPGKMNYTSLQMGNKQMEFNQWILYLVKLLCAIYMIDPAEINFEDSKMGGSQQAPMFYSVSEAKLKMSRDRGLQPLLRFLEADINKNLIWLIDPRYEFQFVGMDSRTEKDMQELRMKELQNWKTIDEVRGEDDLDPLGPEKGGDLIQNPSYITYMTQKAMQAQMGGGGGFPPSGGAPGEESPDFGDEDIGGIDDHMAQMEQVRTPDHVKGDKDMQELDQMLAGLKKSVLGSDDLEKSVAPKKRIKRDFQGRRV